MSLIEFFLQLPLLNQILVVYLIFINLVSFFYFGLDKLKSQFNDWRISEKTLWVITLFGGSIGSMLGMFFFRHKTKKNSFKIVIGLILLLQIGLVSMLFLN